MEFQVGMRFFQVLSDFRVREVELVTIYETTGWGNDGKEIRYHFHFLPANRRGPGFETGIYPNLTIKDGKSGILPNYNVFGTRESAHQGAVDMADRNVSHKRYNVQQATARFQKARLQLQKAQKAAEKVLTPA